MNVARRLDAEIETHAPDETEALGRRIGESLARGGVVFLQGPLGAGKTLLAKGIFASLGIEPRDVVSPSFTLVNRYRAHGEAQPALYHVDLYRLETAADIETLGLEEVFVPDAVVVVEWGERLGSRWGTPDLVVTLEDRGGESRRIRIEGGGRPLEPPDP